MQYACIIAEFTIPFHSEIKSEEYEDNHPQSAKGARRTGMLENQVFIELMRRGYDTDKTMFYYSSRNDKEVDFVLRQGAHVERLVQVCYDMSSPRTENREVSSIIECAGELNCRNLTIITNEEERTIEKDGFTISVVPIAKF